MLANSIDRASPPGSYAWMGAEHMRDRYSQFVIAGGPIGAAKLAFGEAGVATRDAETACHAEALQHFRAEVARRKPDLSVITGIMGPDGIVEPV